MNNKTKIAWFCIFLFVLFSVFVVLTNIYVIKINILRYLDIPTHFFGGTVVAILLLMLLSVIGNPKIKIVVTVVFISVCGFGWEAFEIKALEMGYSIGILFEETSLNKASDLIFGLLGFVTTPYLLKIKINDIYRAGKHKFF